MTLQYKFEHRLHPATNRYINTIQLAAPFSPLFELALLDSPDAVANFLEKATAASQSNSPSRLAFEQIIVEIAPNSSVLEYYDDDNKCVRQAFSTGDLLALLRDWQQFLIDNQSK